MRVKPTVRLAALARARSGPYRVARAGAAEAPASSVSAIRQVVPLFRGQG